MHPEHSSKPLAARLRALSPPSVPEGLESRLLAAIPTARPARRRRWLVYAGLVTALAAACLLAILAWPGRDTRRPDSVNVPNPEIGHGQVEPDTVSVRRESLHNLDEAENATFTWPLEEASPLSVSNSIPADLLN